MSTREQKVKLLMESFHSIKRHGTFGSLGSSTMPRITPAQWGALMLIEGPGTASVKSLAEALGVTSSAATQLVDGLVKSGYVARVAGEDDRRTVRLVLSKKTKGPVTAMKKQITKKFLKLFEVLNEREFNQYLALSKKIVDRFSKQ